MTFAAAESKLCGVPFDRGHSADSAVWNAFITLCLNL